MGRRRGTSSVQFLFGWVRRRSAKVKTMMGLIVGLSAVIGLRFMVKDPNHYYLAGEAIHAAGILVLVYKLITKKNCSGLSLGTQRLTALFLAVRLVCSVLMDADIHVMIDVASFVSTLWVIYMMRFKLRFSYIKELDDMPLYLMVVPCAVLAVFVHPDMGSYKVISSRLWAFGLYLESVSVLPQLHLIRNAKIAEPFTAHYVFALGVSRFLVFAHWIIMVYETKGGYIYWATSIYLWVLAVFIAEMVNTFILARFCYYYVKSIMQGQLLVTRVPIKTI